MVSASSSPEELRQEGRRVIAQFLQSHTVYEVMPRSGKVIVFGVDIPVKLAFHRKRIEAAPSGTREERVRRRLHADRFCRNHSVLSSTAHSRTHSPSIVCTRGELCRWSRADSAMHPHINRPRGLPMRPVPTRRHRIHYLPVLNDSEMQILSIISHLRASYLVREFAEPRCLFDQSIYDLQVGVFDNVISVTDDTPSLTCFTFCPSIVFPPCQW